MKKGDKVLFVRSGIISEIKGETVWLDKENGGKAVVTNNSLYHDHNRKLLNLIKENQTYKPEKNIKFINVFFRDEEDEIERESINYYDTEDDAFKAVSEFYQYVVIAQPVEVIK